MEPDVYAVDAHFGYPKIIENSGLNGGVAANFYVLKIPRNFFFAKQHVDWTDE